MIRIDEITDLQQKADLLRKEAKSLLNEIICTANVLPQGITMPGADRLVDCIISCALLEMTSIIKQSQRLEEKERK